MVFLAEGENQRRLNTSLEHGLMAKRLNRRTPARAPKQVGPRAAFADGRKPCLSKAAPGGAHPIAVKLKVKRITVFRGRNGLRVLLRQEPSVLP